MYTYICTYIYMYIKVYIDFFANRGLKLQNKNKNLWIAPQEYICKNIHVNQISFLDLLVHRVGPSSALCILLLLDISRRGGKKEKFHVSKNCMHVRFLCFWSNVFVHEVGPALAACEHIRFLKMKKYTYIRLECFWK